MSNRVLPTAEELVMLREAYAETYPVRPLMNVIDALREEIEVLRLYGNKDCTAMADEELHRRRAIERA